MKHQLPCSHPLLALILVCLIRHPESCCQNWGLSGGKTAGGRSCSERWGEEVLSVCLSLWVLWCVYHCGCYRVCVTVGVCVCVCHCGCYRVCVSLWVLLCGCHCGCYSVCVGVTVGITVCVCVTAGVTACVCHCGCNCVSVSMWVLLCACVCHCGCYSVCVSLWMFVCVRVWCTYRHVLQKKTSKRNMKWTFPVYYIWENKIIVSVVCDFSNLLRIWWVYMLWPFCLLSVVFRNWQRIQYI